MAKRVPAGESPPNELDFMCKAFENACTACGVAVMLMFFSGVILGGGLVLRELWRLY